MRSQSHCQTGGHHGRPSSTSAAAPRVGLDRGRGARAAHAGVGRPATTPRRYAGALRPAGESRGDLVRVVGEGPFTPLRQVRDGAASCPRRGGGAAG
jgi:hypothetical protein